MSAIFTKIVAFFISILAFFGININNPYETPVEVEPESITQEFVINEDKTISVVFTENPSTGYTWEYDVMSGSADAKTNEYISPVNSDGLVGAAGTRHYTFDNFADGTTEIVFQYLRPWEDVLPAHKYKLVVIKEDGEIASAALFNLYEN